MTAVLNTFTQVDGTALTSSATVTGYNLHTGTPVAFAGRARYAAAGGASCLHRINLDATSLTAAVETLWAPLPAAAPAAEEQIISVRNSTGAAFSLRWTPTGNFRLCDSAGATVWTSAQVYVAQNFRAFVYGIVDTASTGTLHVETYLGEHRVPLETFDSGPTRNLGTTALTSYQVGRISTGAAAVTIDVADTQGEANRTTPFGPVMPTLNAAGLAVIGDSQTAQNGNVGLGDTGDVENALVTYGGWLHTNTVVDAVVGRSIIGTAVLPSAPQQVNQFRVDGFDPKTWLIPLGGNGIHDTLAQQQSYINGLLDYIANGTTGIYRVYWPNVVRQDQTDVEVDRFWTALQAVKAARTDVDLRIFNLDDLIHAQNETGFWQADGVHMTDAGYAVRNQLVAQNSPYASPSTASLSITRVQVAGVIASAALTLAITRVQVSGDLGSLNMTLAITRVQVNGAAVPSSQITRTADDNWQVAEDPADELFAASELLADLAQTAEQVTWSLTPGIGAGGVSAAGAITWGPCMAAGASHTGASASGYHTWRGSASGIRT